MGILMGGAGTLVGVLMVALGLLSGWFAVKFWRASAATKDQVLRARFERTNANGVEVFSDWDAVKQAERDGRRGFSRHLRQRFAAVILAVAALFLVTHGLGAVVGSLTMGAMVARAESIESPAQDAYEAGTFNANDYAPAPAGN
jgi:hypothetical protein